MSRIAKSALQRICETIRVYRAKRYSSDWQRIEQLIAQHDRILRRWPNAYAS